MARNSLLQNPWDELDKRYDFKKSTMFDILGFILFSSKHSFILLINRVNFWRYLKKLWTTFIVKYASERKRSFVELHTNWRVILLAILFFPDEFGFKTFTFESFNRFDTKRGLQKRYFFLVIKLSGPIYNERFTI